ncbi:MAG: hypothetical protein ABW321_06530 [Polyangiales bacterium]
MLRAYSVLCLLIASLAGCGDMDSESSCRDICRRFRDCIDGAYSVDRCEDRCNEQDDSRRASYAIDECNACLEHSSCEGSVYNCTYECGWIVPYSQ